MEEKAECMGCILTLSWSEGLTFKGLTFGEFTCVGITFIVEEPTINNLNVKPFAMSTIKTFEELDVWKVSRELCNKIGILIDSGCFGKNFRLIGQIEGSSGSVMDNIAEGFERATRLEFIQFLGYSKGSNGEFRSQLYRALDRKYITKDQFEEHFSLAVRISAMLQKFITYLQKTEIQGERRKT